MNTLTLDIEADGLLEDATKIHMCYVSVNGEDPLEWGPQDLRDWNNDLDQIPAILIGHNILGYDLPVLERLWGITWSGPVYDTLIASQVAYSDIGLISQKNPASFPKRNFENPWSHSLGAWGIRLGYPKISFDPEKFKDPSEEDLAEMRTYCAQDVQLNYEVYEFLQDSQRVPQGVLEMEQQVKRIIMQQQDNGFLLDPEACHELMFDLTPRRNELVQSVRESFGDVLRPKGKPFVPKQDNSRFGYKEGCACQKVEWQEFNPNSSKHIIYWLKKKYGWEPTKFTEKGQPCTDGETLRDLPYEECNALAELADIKKILGYVSEGDNAWLKVVHPETLRVHGQVRTMGCVTGRMSHNSPNLGQIPRRGPKGEACRKCFTVPEGRRLVGADASGLELRCLAHYLAAFDGGEYIKVVTTGDVHSFNQEAAGLPTRDHAKTFIYGWLYGAGAAKIGAIVEKGPREGGRLKARFLKNLPAVAKLRDAVSKKVKQTGYLKGLDGRLLPIRADYSALNTLLQSAGAIIMKQALVILEPQLPASAMFVCNCHDEVQIEV
jgi:DNA polymerase I-like protein with 3'-5' exonuclease and polymerase domains